jgi:hypothetical protein
VLHEWLDSWSGIGVIERGMARQGYDLQLTPYANEGWRATFFLTGREHSMRQATGSAWEPTPWRAVQGAVWEALRKGEPGGLTGKRARRQRGEGRSQAPRHEVNGHALARRTEPGSQRAVTRPV